MNFYIADPHFGHSNIIKLCDRPFNTVEDMDDEMIRRWNNKVKKTDTVYILGDFAKNLTCAKNIIKQLNGNKILIRGNHDTDPICELFDKCYPYLEVTDNNTKLVLCHYPLWDWNGMYRNTLHLYGHVHEKNMGKNNSYCVSVEHIDFAPTTLQELIN